MAGTVPDGRNGQAKITPMSEFTWSAFDEDKARRIVFQDSGKALASGIYFTILMLA